MQTLVDSIQSTLGLALAPMALPRQFSAAAPPDRIRGLLTRLRDEFGFSHLAFLNAIDWIEDGQFELVYMLHNYPLRIDLALCARIPRDPASMESLHDLWAHLATHQRELREMFGIDFPGSPGVCDDFILEDGPDVPPMRRDFDSLAHAQAHYPERPGRFTLDPNAYKKEQLAKQAAATAGAQASGPPPSAPDAPQAGKMPALLQPPPAEPQASCPPLLPPEPRP
jgi:NADH-quinone oxidoreductase subunit C